MPVAKSRRRSRSTRWRRPNGWARSISSLMRSSRQSRDRRPVEGSTRSSAEWGTTLVALVGMTVGDDPRLGVCQRRGQPRVPPRRRRTRAGHGRSHAGRSAGARRPPDAGRGARPSAAQHRHAGRSASTRGCSSTPGSSPPVVGDRYLLCSDGLFNELDSPGSSRCFIESTMPPRAAVALVFAACEAGGRDNVTVVIVDVVDTDAAADNVGRGSDHRSPQSVARTACCASTRRPRPGPSDPHPDEIEVDRTVEKPPSSPGVWLSSWRRC